METSFSIDLSQVVLRNTYDSSELEFVYHDPKNLNALLLKQQVLDKRVIEFAKAPLFQH